MLKSVLFITISEEIFGIWFYDSDECKRLSTLMKTWVKPVHGFSYCYGYKLLSFEPHLLHKASF